MPPLPRKLILLAALGVLAQTSALAHTGRVSDAVTVTAHASASTSLHRFNLVLAGGSGPDVIHISLSADGRSYLIDSSTALEAGGAVCANPPDNPDELA